MRCDECRFWKERYKGIDWAYGECTEIVGFIDIGTNGEGVTDIETDADFFCAAFELRMMSNHRNTMEEICKSMVSHAVDAHNSTHVDFKGASFFTKKQINSALQNSYNKGLGRLECEIASEIHVLSFHGNKNAILNYDQAVFVNKYADILVMMELDDDEA